MLPEPFYERDGIAIYCGDARELLPLLPPIDLVLTDPPYGLGERWNGGGGTSNSSWRFNPDEAKSWDAETVGVVSSLPSLARHAVIWGGNYYQLPPSRCWFLWDKKQNDKWTTGQAEMAWTNLDRPVRIFRLSQAEAITEMRTKVHPTQKPESLMRWCIAMCPNDCVSILDPFAGSGTTLVAAKAMGRQAIGIEKNARYCELAVQRLQQQVMVFA